MSAEIITLADRRGAPAGADRTDNAAAAAAVLRAACRALAANLAAFRRQAQTVRDQLNAVREGAGALAASSGGIVDTLRAVAAARPAFAEEAALA